MNKYNVAWMNQVEADSPEEAAELVLASLATGEFSAVFHVGSKCGCGTFHPEQIETLDLTVRGGSIDLPALRDL